MTPDGPLPPPDHEDEAPSVTNFDAPPSGEEAEAEREETIAPLLWIGGGFVLILAFVAFLFIAGRAPLKHTGVDVVHAQQQP